MSKRKLPLIQNFECPEGIDFGPRADQVQRWDALIGRATNAEGKTVIEIMDVIGRDPFFGGGVGSVDVANALRGAKDVVVNLNSPGGLFSEGNAIYNLLVQHPFEVTVNVLSLAASAASIVMMAGDVVNIVPSGFVFIHNGQAVVMGDRHDMAAVIDDLEKIDAAISGIYEARTGRTAAQIAKWMDAETTFTAKEAKQFGFADNILEPNSVQMSVRNDSRDFKAVRFADSVFAEKGKTRAERRDLIKAIKAGAPAATSEAMPGAGLSAVADDLRGLLSKL